MLEWEASAGPWLVSGAVFMALGPALWFAKRKNAALAAYLSSMGIVHTAAAIARMWSDRPEELGNRIGLLAVVELCILTATVAYVWFLGQQRTPLSAWLRGYPRYAIILLAIIGTLSFLIWPELWWLDGRDNGPLRVARRILNLGLFTLGFLVALSLYRRSAGQAKRQAGWYLLGFGVHDAVLFIQVSVDQVLRSTGRDGHPDYDLYFGITQSAPLLFLAGCLAYGALKWQLFDIDLRLKFGLRQGTIAGIFIAAFFAVSEIVASLLSDRLGVIAGVSATAVLVFAISPLQRLADRVSNKAMPKVRADDEYVTLRKAEVYQAAFESALSDGKITEAERDVLAALQDQLGLLAGEARQIEKSVAA